MIISRGFFPTLSCRRFSFFWNTTIPSAIENQIRHGDGTLGWREHAPYDAIFVSASGPFAPPSLLQQLAINGRLVMPVGRDTHHQVLIRYTKEGPESVFTEGLGPVAFVPLVGTVGWQQEQAN
jgi:protein-L-isoaspartate(D-aspartate) O-methyltransferase